MDSESGVNCWEKIGGVLAVSVVGFLIWEDHIWGWGLLACCGFLFGRVIGLCGALIVVGIGLLIWDDAMWGWRLMIGGASLVVLAEILTRRWRSATLTSAELNKAPLAEVAIHAELAITYVDGDGKKSPHRITVRAVAPRGLRDLALTAFCHEDGVERSFRLTRVRKMIDLEADEVVSNRFAFIRGKMAMSRRRAMSRKKGPEPAQSDRPKTSEESWRPQTEVAIHAELVITYVDVDGQKSLRRVTVSAAGPSGPRDLTLTAFCHEEQESRTFRLTRVKEMVDLETDEVVGNRFAFIRKKMVDSFDHQSPSPVYHTECGQTPMADTASSVNGVQGKKTVF